MHRISARSIGIVCSSLSDEFMKGRMVGLYGKLESCIGGALMVRVEWSEVWVGVLLRNWFDRNVW